MPPRQRPKLLPVPPTRPAHDVSPSLRLSVPPPLPLRHSATLPLLIATLLLCACQASNPAHNAQVPAGGVRTPFAPASIRVHPLTHFDRDADGRAVLVAHVELLDAWNDTVKGVGALELQLYRPLGASGAVASQELAWRLDLNDAETNATLYDPATRTYRIQLGGLPAWVEPLVDRRGESGRAVIRAVLRTLDPQGGDRVLRDELSIGG